MIFSNPFSSHRRNSFKLREVKSPGQGNTAPPELTLGHRFSCGARQVGNPLFSLFLEEIFF